MATADSETRQRTHPSRTRGLKNPEQEELGSFTGSFVIQGSPVPDFDFASAMFASVDRIATRKICPGLEVFTI
jgi:hypothetical protein